MNPDLIAQQHLDGIRRALGVTPPELTPEQAAWDALTKQQRAFVLRGLGLDPHTLTYRTLTLRQRQAFRQAVQLAPEQPAPLHNLAWSLIRQARFQEALPIAREAATKGTAAQYRSALQALENPL